MKDQSVYYSLSSSNKTSLEVGWGIYARLCAIVSLMERGVLLHAPACNDAARLFISLPPSCTIPKILDAVAKIPEYERQTNIAAIPFEGTLELDIDTREKYVPTVTDKTAIECMHKHAEKVLLVRYLRHSRGFDLYHAKHIADAIFEKFKDDPDWLDVE